MNLQILEQQEAWVAFEHEQVRLQQKLWENEEAAREKKEQKRWMLEQKIEYERADQKKRDAIFTRFLRRQEEAYAKKMARRKQILKQQTPSFQPSISSSKKKRLKASDNGNITAGKDFTPYLKKKELNQSHFTAKRLDFKQSTMARNLVTAVDLLSNEMKTDFASGSGGKDAAINKNIENNDTQYNNTRKQSKEELLPVESTNDQKEPLGSLLPHHHKAPTFSINRLVKHEPVGFGIDKDIKAYSPFLTSKGKMSRRRSGSEMFQDSVRHHARKQAMVRTSEVACRKSTPFTPTFFSNSAISKRAKSALCDRYGLTSKYQIKRSVTRSTVKVVKSSETKGSVPSLSSPRPTRTSQARAANTRNQIIEDSGIETIKKRVEPSTYISRCHEKNERKQQQRQLAERTKQQAIKDICTFKPVLATCPSFIRRLANGSRLTLNRKKENALPLPPTTVTILKNERVQISSTSLFKSKTRTSRRVNSSSVLAQWGKSIASLVPVTRKTQQSIHLFPILPPSPPSERPEERKHMCNG